MAQLKQHGLTAVATKAKRKSVRLWLPERDRDGERYLTEIINNNIARRIYEAKDIASKVTSRRQAGRECV